MSKKTKILVVRLLGLGDVTCIGIPGSRYIEKQFPDAEITFLTHGVGKDIINLANPNMSVINIEKGDWPDDLIPAMQTFLLLARDIIGQEFDLIINLDTWFMPCLMTRFLKDAGVPVQGNYLNISIEQLLQRGGAQQLNQEYVHDPAKYMASTFSNMSAWHKPWWLEEPLPELGYPEFYLKSCCGFTEMDMDMSIDVEPNPVLAKTQNNKKVIALNCKARTEERNYPYEKALKKQLEKAGFYVWSGFDGKDSIKKTLSKLKATDLLISVPSAPQWMAKSVGCASFIISGQVDARTLMPEFATEKSDKPVSASTIVEQITTIFRTG